MSHSKFVKCLPRGEDYNAIEYAREELAALRKKHALRANLDANASILRRVHTPRHDSTAKHS